MKRELQVHFLVVLVRRSNSWPCNCIDYGSSFPSSRTLIPRARYTEDLLQRRFPRSSMKVLARDEKSSLSGYLTRRYPFRHLLQEKSSHTPSVRTTKKHRDCVNWGCRSTFFTTKSSKKANSILSQLHFSDRYESNS